MNTMTEIIAAHQPSRWRSFTNENTILRCCGQDFGNATKKPKQGDAEKAYAEHAAHVADELTKAGYGLLPDFMHEYGAPLMGVNGPAGPPVEHGYIRDPNFLTKSTHHRLVTPWRELTEENR